MSKFSMRRALSVLTIAAATTATSVLGLGSAAEAKVVCSAGTWGGNHGWGDCTENSVPGPRKWQLKTACSWGSTASSGIITGPGHVDTTCPWPQSASYSYIVYYN
ncbi:hypothetical protein AB0F73_18445 [Micromonospora purpureochromogenes]|uniref:hypothetical protein n=1 Tax=Micromonospora purpureochromogenes TaxID=47872 RepID=UPI00340EF47D